MAAGSAAGDILMYSDAESPPPSGVRCGRDAQSFKRNRQAAYQLWAELARKVLETDVAAAEASGDSSLRVCLAKLKASG